MEQFDFQRMEKIKRRLDHKLKPFKLASKFQDRFCLEFFHSMISDEVEFEALWRQKLPQLEALRKGGVCSTRMELLFGLSRLRAQMESADARRDKKFNYNSTEADPISAKHVCRTALEDLQPISISELRSNRVHRGRVLKCELFTPVAWVVGLHLGVEDEFGDVMKLTLYNVIPRTTTPETFFPEGTKVYILEPYLKCAFNGRLGLRVDNKCNVVIETPSREMCMSAEEWKAMGNENFKANEYKSAVECYEKSIELAGTNLKIKCLTNIALCEIKLERYECALKRCNEALTLDPNDQKAIYRKISALSSLREHITASSLLSQNMNKKDAAWDKLGKRVKRRAREAAGEHDMETRALIDAGSKDVEMFIGTVEVKFSKGKGRGVFATEGIRRGEMIICEKGISFEHDVNESMSTTMAFDFDTRLTNTASQEGVIRAMIEASENPIIGKRLKYLYDGTEASKQHVPAMSLFESDRCDEDFGEHVLSYAQAQGIQTFNSFGNSLQDSLAGSKCKERSCVFPLISFINTASRKTKQNAIILHLSAHYSAIYATCNIAKGKEVIIDYAQGKSGKERKDLLKKFGVGVSTKV